MPVYAGLIGVLALGKTRGGFLASFSYNESFFLISGSLL